MKSSNRQRGSRHNLRARHLQNLLTGMLVACAMMIAATSASAMTTLTDWFKVSPQTLNEWDAVVLPQQTNYIRIKPKSSVTSQSLRRVLVLYPRRSSAYDTAISTFLNVIFDKRINVELTVVNYQNEDARAKQAIDQAETNNFDLILSMGSGIDRLAVDQLQRRPLARRHRLLEGPRIARPIRRVRPGVWYQFRLHIPQHADRRADVLCPASAAQPQEPRHSGRCQQRQRRPDPGHARQGLSSFARHSRARRRRQEPGEGQGRDRRAGARRRHRHAQERCRPLQLPALDHRQYAAVQRDLDHQPARLPRSRPLDGHRRRAGR